MNATMRLYLDENWEEEFEDSKPERERKPAKSQLSQWLDGGSEPSTARSAFGGVPAG